MLGNRARRAALIALAVTLAGGSLLVVQGRRRFIQTWFRDGPPGPAPALSQPTGGTGGLAPVERVRVLLVDGLDRATAAALPALDSLCRAGTDLLVDVGFPTVSLPVQSVLWTGWTQQQSGLLYRIAPLTLPPPDAVAVRVPGSVAVVEDQPFIAGSFGFELRSGSPPRWADEGFPPAARESVATAARLVFVHVLRVDKAGHRGGARSEAYRRGARWADGLLGELLKAAPPDARTRWFVLSDHGHRLRGGHGGSEWGVRIVRACIAGGAPSGVRGGGVHLVDLARAVHDSLGLGGVGGAGRPLGFAVAHPDPDATLPRVPPGRVLVAVLIALMGLVVSVAEPLRSRRARAWASWLRSSTHTLPLWLPIAYLSVVMVRGMPTLSNPIVYPPLGWDAIVAGVPGLVALAVACVLAGRRLEVVTFCRVQLALPVGVVFGALVACRGIEAMVSGRAAPPLSVFWTAHASVLMSLLAAAGPVLGVACLVAAVRPGGDRGGAAPPHPTPQTASTSPQGER
jgi:hypothetical protein